MTNPIRTKLSLALVLLLTACTATSAKHDAGVAVPAAWSKHSDAALAPAVADKVDHQWWGHFDDPVLTTLMTQALAGNKTLAIAKARVEEARALRGVNRSALFPQVNANAGVSRGNEGVLANDQTASLSEANVEATWELDIFGRNQARVREAGAILESEEASRQAVMVGLLAEVARTYFEARNLESQLNITRRNLDTQTQTLDLINAQLQGAYASDFDVQRASAQVSITQSQLPVLQTGYDAAVNRLNVLLGQSPGTAITGLSTRTPYKKLDSNIVLSAPATVLATRPDVAAAERLFAARAEGTKAARAELFPRISLLGLFGVQDSSAMSASPWGIGASLVQPVLNFGRIRGQIDAADAREEQAFLAYQQTVLEAVENMENALSGYYNEMGRNTSLRNAFTQTEKASELARQQYTSGYIGLLDLLVIQRQVLDAESALAASDAKLRQDLVNIYTAAGGGWDIPANQP